MKIKASTIRMKRRMELLGLIASMMAGDMKSAQGLPITTWTQFSTLFLTNFPEGIAPADLSTRELTKSLAEFLETLLANVRKSKLDLAAEVTKILVAIPRQKKSGNKKRIK
jgi:hypothetical protein